jgi:hypothetical protein
MLFTYEVVLTSKPHLFFYSQNPDEAKKVTKLDYSWFVWDNVEPLALDIAPRMFWEGRSL